MQRFPAPHPPRQQEQPTEQPAEQHNGETEEKSPKPDKTETPSEKGEQPV